MNQALEALGCDVTPVALYRWELPDDLGPLREAAVRLAARELDVVLFTSSIQLDQLLDVARTLGIETDVRRGLLEGIIPNHPKMRCSVTA